MSKTLLNGPPSPEDFQRQISDFMRQHFQNVPPQAGTETDNAGGAEAKPTRLTPEQFDFHYKPREIKEYLDRFVIKQDEAKKVLSVALCDHYHHVRLALEGKELPNYAKQNIILIGPTGVGKTFLIRKVADLIGVPFVKPDAATARPVSEFRSEMSTGTSAPPIGRTRPIPNRKLTASSAQTRPVDEVTKAAITRPMAPSASRALTICCPG